MELNYENNNNKKLFIKILLKRGKKNKAEKIIKNILINIKKKTKKNPNKIIKTFLRKTAPKLKYIEINKKRKRKKKSKLYTFIYLFKDKQIKISIKWLIIKKNQINYEIVTKKILQAIKNKGSLIIKKKNYYKEIKKLKFFY